MSDVTAPSLRTRTHLTKDQRLPKYIKDAEKVIRSVKTCQSNFKTLMANSRLRGQHYKKVYSLTFNVLKYYDYIETIIEKIKLVEKEDMLRREVASILIYEIIFGNDNLIGESKPILTIQKYKNDIKHAHEELQCSGEVKIKDLDIPRYARVHTLVTTVPYVIKDLEYQGYQQIFYNDDISEKEYLKFVKSLRKNTFLVDLHFKDLLVFAYNENLVQLQLYSKGHIFLQDKSSYIPVHALNPEPGSAVLDACAAPGMKSVHLAAKMQNKGLLIAYEKDAERFGTLKEMLQYGTVKISKIFCKDFTLVDPSDQAYLSIDYILLDPSCSGSGMVNRMDQVTNTGNPKNKERLEKLAGFQIILLKHALKFPSVKRVVYSTCSINEEENEYVVHEALSAFQNTFKLVPVFPEWSVRGSKDYEFGKLCLRTIPEKHLTNGFFVAMFERLEYAEHYAISQKISKKSGVTSESNYISEELRSSESLHEAKRSKKTEINALSETFHAYEENNYSVSERKKSKKRNSKLQTELEGNEIIDDMSVNFSVNHKKKKQSKIDSERNYNTSVKEQEIDLEYQKKNDSFEKCSMKAKKNKKHKHADNSDLKSSEEKESHIMSTISEKTNNSIPAGSFLENTNSKKKHFQTSDTVKNENIFDISNSYSKVISDNSENLFQGIILEDNLTRKSKIQQPHCFINETVGSVDASPKKHKKSKKHKHSQYTENDICDNENTTEYILENCPVKHKKSKKHKKKSQDIINDILINENQTEYILEKNSGFLENCPMKHKKSKKRKNCSQDCINDAHHDENLVTGECVLEMKKKKLEDNLTRKSKIQQPHCFINETVGSVDASPKKHKKSKKHKHSQYTENDICDNENTTEYILEKNIGSLENCPVKHKKSKKHKKNHKIL